MAELYTIVSPSRTLKKTVYDLLDSALPCFERPWEGAPPAAKPPCASRYLKSKI